MAQEPTIVNPQEFGGLKPQEGPGPAGLCALTNKSDTHPHMSSEPTWTGRDAFTPAQLTSSKP